MKSGSMKSGSMESGSTGRGRNVFKVTVHLLRWLIAGSGRRRSPPPRTRATSSSARLFDSPSARSSSSSPPQRSTVAQPPATNVASAASAHPRSGSPFASLLLLRSPPYQSICIFIWSSRRHHICDHRDQSHSAPIIFIAASRHHRATLHLTTAPVRLSRDSPPARSSSSQSRRHQAPSNKRPIIFVFSDHQQSHSAPSPAIERLRSGGQTPTVGGSSVGGRGLIGTYTFTVYVYVWYTERIRLMIHQSPAHLQLSKRFRNYIKRIRLRLQEHTFEHAFRN